MSVKKQTLHMETTSIAPGRTAGEIISQLVLAGANQINQSFDAGKIVGIRWTMRVSGSDLLFDMPVRVDPVFQILHKRRPTYLRHKYEAADREQAERVAWRQLLRWIQAQIAMIQTGMVEAGEVFMPYMFDPVKSQTLFQTMMESQYKMLPAPEKPQ